MVGKVHKIKMIKCVSLVNETELKKTLYYCFFGQCINNETKQIFYHFFL